LGYSEKVVVIGGGISGLACAYRLKQMGIACLVLEASERAGGVIATIRRDGLLFETGPQCPRFSASVWGIVRELGLESEFLAGDPKAKRYILRDGRLCLAPVTPGGLIRTKLLGFSSKLRIMGEVFGHSHPPENEETLAEFVERKFGVEVLENLVDPIVSTVFLGDCYKMGMDSAFPALVEWERRHGSLMRGAIRTWRSKAHQSNSNGSSSGVGGNGRRDSLRLTDALPALGSFRKGMAVLPERVAQELHIRYGADVGCVEAAPGEEGAAKAVWRVRLRDGENIVTRNLVLATPAYAAAEVLGGSVPQLASELESIEYAPMSAVSFVYEQAQVANSLNGFGFMAPRREGLNTICTFWNSSLFRGRAPEGRVLLTSFVRGATEEPKDEVESMDAVEYENARTLGIAGKPVDLAVWQSPRALPQYNVHHARRVAEIASILGTVPNLSLAGNYLRGRAIGDCVDVAFRVAEEVSNRLRSEQR